MKTVDRRVTRRVTGGLVAGALVATALVAGSPAASAAPSVAHARGAGIVLDSTLITEVLAAGQRVTAVALELRHRVTLTDGTARFVAVTTTTAGGETVQIPATAVYSNDAPEIDNEGRKGQSGRFLIVDVDETDPRTATIGYDIATGRTVSVVQPYTVSLATDRIPARWLAALPVSLPTVVSSGAIDPLVDLFRPSTYTGSNGTTMDVRTFSPQRYLENPDGAETYPLVVVLHGAGESGAGNGAQLLANQSAVAFADPDRQEGDPSFVMAPQINSGFWDDANVRQALSELIEQTAATYPIDPERVYVAGLSMGGFGVYSLLANYPDRFAGGLVIAAGASPALTPLLTDVPLWIHHSADDAVVPYSYAAETVDRIEAAGAVVTRGTWAGDLPTEAAEAQALALTAQAEATGSHVLFTTYTAGTTPVSSHASWIPTFSNDVVLDWLLEQRRAGQ
ncbi:alpha/beta hydrolase-fold protein [Micromonospora sp. DT81.3]|uniref:alpha/beta hydrolase-fold protein n=1 Tax=Micromonospora sp. DT81.3 TaxID=3416523 RepID=UPI003CF356F7